MPRWRVGRRARPPSIARGALRELTAKLRRDVSANTAKIESVVFDRPLPELLDFEVTADHWSTRFRGYRRREKVPN